jgi:hypothetical protein
MTNEQISKTPEWLVVVAYLHSSGAHAQVLTEAQQRNVRRMADGYGAHVTQPELLWDWSHVRDSSWSAIRAMATTIAAMVAP